VEKVSLKLVPSLAFTAASYVFVEPKKTMHARSENDICPISKTIHRTRLIERETFHVADIDVEALEMTMSMIFCLTCKSLPKAHGLWIACVCSYCLSSWYYAV